ncbi:MAG: LacI family DNA-binding transcriptional regulator [Chloroflexota bacterium]|nr:LacI family DNA-binding transcriptional regulator [Chloroflexota bacterium]
MPRQVTLRDVAEYAGVSVTTVSNVVRDWPYVSPETRLKVKSAIDSLGYSPHLIAQSLRTGQMNALAFIVPDLSNPYFAEIVGAAEDAAQEQGYTVLVFNSHEDHEREAACIRRARRHFVDGLLIAHTAATPQDSTLWHDSTLPIVAIDRTPPYYSGASCVMDNVRAGILATEHLWSLGHQRIAHIAGPRTVRPARERMEGYKAALAQHGMVYRTVRNVEHDWNADEGYRAMSALLDAPEHPTAVFASNDALAIGALHAIDERGLRVPNDISVVGVDDIEISRHLRPPLTTVRQPREDMARMAVDLLLRHIREESVDEPVVMLQPELIVRQSTAPYYEGAAS